MRQTTLQKQRHMITVACLSLFLAAIVAYMYFLSLSVFHVVMRKEVLHDINALRSEIAFLESKYIEANYEISQRVASTNDFSAIRDKVFIKQNHDSSLVLRNTNE